MRAGRQKPKGPTTRYTIHRTPYSDKCGDTKESAPRRLAAVGYGSGSVRALWWPGRVKVCSNPREGLPVAAEGLLGDVGWVVLIAWTTRTGCRALYLLTLFEGSDVSLQCTSTFSTFDYRQKTVKDWWRLGWVGRLEGAPRTLGSHAPHFAACSHSNSKAHRRPVNSHHHFHNRISLRRAGQTCVFDIGNTR